LYVLFDEIGNIQGEFRNLLECASVPFFPNVPPEEMEDKTIK
jgi:hypothetical protein